MDPRAAVSAANSFIPTIIIQEMSFDGDDGLDLLAKFRHNRLTRNVPIIVFSSKEDAAFRNGAFSSGANDYFFKSGDPSELLARIRYHALRHQRADSIERQQYSLLLPTKHIVRVLMIEVSKAACLLVKSELEKAETVEFRYTDNPRAALQFADEMMPTVVVQSLSVGRFGGFDLLQALRRHEATRDVPIIVLSGISDANQKVHAFELGADDYVVKSADMAELVNRIRIHSSEYFNLLKVRFQTQCPSDARKYPVKLLMVDDSKFVCFAIGRMLQHEINIDFAYETNGNMAYERAKQLSPTVILQDLEMPEVNGLELVKKYRSDPMLQDVPIIILSATTDAAVKAKAFAAGANDYVQKDMDRIELLSRIQYHTRGYINFLRLNDSIQQLLETQKRLEIHSSFIKKTFGRYLSEDVVDSLLDSPEGLKLGGESRNISLLMADLRGFTALSESLAAHEVLRLINIFLAVMTEIIFKYDGTIDEFIGDAILAMFGAPRIAEDHAKLAVACALEMQLAMEGVNTRLKKEGYPEVTMGIGINTGEVIVGNIGSEKRSKYGIVGRNVNLTSRIESYTVGGQILVSENTVEACAGLLRIDDTLTVMPKGVREPVAIHLVGGIGEPYNLYLPAAVVRELRPLRQKIDVSFTVLEGKHAGTEVFHGQLAKVLDNEALLVSEVQLEPRSDICMSLPAHLGHGQAVDELFAKVMARESGGYRIYFTSISVELKKTYRE